VTIRIYNTTGGISTVNDVGILGSAATLLGKTDLLGTNAAMSDYALWMRLKALQTGTLTSLNFYVNTTAGTYLRLALYSDAAGNIPGVVLAQGSVAPAGTSWKSVAVNVALTKDTYYHLAVVSDCSTLYNATGGSRYYQAFTNNPIAITPDALDISIYGAGIFLSFTPQTGNIRIIA
jgi:hypothetical protein